MKEELTDLEIDALKEVGNVGVGNAATALSKMLNKPVQINLPNSSFVPLNEFSKEIGGPDDIVTSLYLEITGDYIGQCLFIFPEKSAKNFIDLIMMQEEGTIKELGDMEISAFKEMANIFVGAYLTALGDMLQGRLFPGIPATATDMLQSILDMSLIKLAEKANEILRVKTDINIEGHEIQGQFIIMFEEESYEKILDFLKSYYLN